MKGDEAGRRLPAMRSRVGLDAKEAFPLSVEFLKRIWEQKARSCSTVSHNSVCFCLINIRAVLQKKKIQVKSDLKIIYKMNIYINISSKKSSAFWSV